MTVKNKETSETILTSLESNLSGNAIVDDDQSETIKSCDTTSQESMSENTNIFSNQPRNYVQQV